MKSCWKTLNEIIKKSTTKKSLPSHFIINNNLTSNQQEIANGFNNFLVKIGKSISDNMEQVNSHYSRHLKGKQTKNFFLGPITPGDIINTASKLKPKQSTGQDNISNKLLKNTIEEISVPLTHIFNLSLETGTVPDEMKIAKVIPIFKKGNVQNLNNYRPISLLPVISKLLERIVYNQLTRFITDNNTLYKHQYGFRKKHSTAHPILQLIKSITTLNDKPSKDLTIATFLDLSKAFDTVSHHILLTNRKQYVQIDSQTSDIKQVICGVPQGSILGPLLFLLYINDLSNSTSLNLLSFADDTTVYSSGQNIEDITILLNSELEKIYIWLLENKLSINIEKTKFMIFSPNGRTKFQNIPVHIQINHKQIIRCGTDCNEKTVTFLGVKFDEHLSWKEHVSSVAQKVSRTLFALNSVKNVLPRSALITLYHTLIESHINYNLLAWGNSSAVSRLEKLQKQSIRIIFNKPYRAHTEPLFKQAQILKIKDKYELDISQFGFSYIHMSLPLSFVNFFPPRPTRASSRTVNYLYSHRPRTNFSSSSVYHMIPTIWNNLPNEQKSLSCKNTFKNAIKTLKLQQYNRHVLFCNNPNCIDCKH